ncbi:capsid assembly protein [Pectobacterium phage Jarilo]|uniref:Capsid assembly protein n=1 Tax=Pectobacterium phage Jarilo TaxID=2163634 RepID=A0A2S1GT00_9CAUD|nr:head assembly [Pectobacterium phage Jarilo]AWD92513.1 capsid assembly protein [Pectobacterium phage Jarilo]
MSQESNADVYTSFGANPAVLTGSSPQEHAQNMLALDVSARDGDDAITIVEQEDDIYGGHKDPYEDPDAPDDGFMQIRIGNDDPQDTLEVGADGEVNEGEAEEFKPLGETPSDLTTAADQISQHAEGFQTMVDQAAERGLVADSIVRIQSEYEGDGISEQSYGELEAAGYSRAFVDSYIRGQEALVDSYVSQVVAFAGGQERFSTLHAHLTATNPDAAQTLETALGNRDMGTLKAIINLAGQSFNTKFGKPATRSVTQRAIPVAPQGSKGKSEGYTSQAEMMKDMNDPRYRTDSKFRASVESKVIHASF